jgi:hypothetical protein
VKWATVACSLALAGLAGCSFGDDGEPEPPPATVRAVEQTVSQLERAIAGGDWEVVCKELFTASARRRAGGRACPRLLRSDAEGLRRPTIRILRIDVEDGRVAVRVRSRSGDQQPISDVIELRRVDGEYRVDALAG